MVSHGDPDEHRRLAEEHHWCCAIVLQRDWESSNGYRANGTPIGYLPDARGIIRRDLAVGVDAILRPV